MTSQNGDFGKEWKVALDTAPSAAEHEASVNAAVTTAEVPGRSMLVLKRLS